jgi:hypothetical protein
VVEVVQVHLAVTVVLLALLVLGAMVQLQLLVEFLLHMLEVVVELPMTVAGSPLEAQVVLAAVALVVTL